MGQLLCSHRHTHTHFQKPIFHIVQTKCDLRGKGKFYIPAKLLPDGLLNPKYASTSFSAASRSARRVHSAPSKPQTLRKHFFTILAPQWLNLLFPEQCMPLGISPENLSRRHRIDIVWSYRIRDNRTGRLNRNRKSDNNETSSR